MAAVVKGSGGEKDSLTNKAGACSIRVAGVSENGSEGGHGR